MSNPFDAIVIGGGIAGVSLAYELASERTVVLLEAESTLAHHTTGRSAATWLGTYGNEPVRALAAASRSFLVEPPEAMFEAPLTKPLGLLYVAGLGQSAALRALHRSVAELTPEAQLLDRQETLAANRLLHPERIEGGLIEPGAMDVDVNELHAGYARALRRRGGQIVTRSRVIAAERVSTGWRVTTSAGDTYTSPVVVNAAGAWVDEVAALHGAAPIGVRPLRRTMFAAPADGVDLASVPMTFAIDHSFYFKPEGPQLLCSPQDETLSPPGDAKPDELEIARAIEAINEITTLNIRHVRSPWAGLRTFAPDSTPVVGWAADADDLYWYAGQGGYGIQIGPAMARFAAAEILGHPVPPDIAATLSDPSVLSPRRFAAAPARS
ncbi:FAD-dependent oxidoreductase [Nocardioides sp. CER19]|uniref:NAD(P)/FAD-dependent oxidoreductase n=1 Tax=Nocardioides sp. CER19 TaxID=3038538 RepID=UPI002449FE0E|nr:FAD-dependent oxidoreductase [Nocardioides sp. CER19]MDH2416134.1 FAD-dependent oxidoreductase [Nocardioides sp. CER19]